MTTSFFNTPSSSDLIGIPDGDYFVHKFPEDLAVAETLKVVINNVDGKLINFTGEKLQPDKRPKQPNKLSRHIEIMLRFPERIKAIKLFLDKKSQIIFVLGKRNTKIIVKPEIFKPSESHIITYYNKKNNMKKKLLNASYFGSGHPVIDMHRAMANCEVVIAVDTNCREVPGIGKVAATTAIEATVKVLTDDACHMQSGPLRQRIMENPSGNPEILGIGAMMKHFFDTNPELNDKKIGIITDTELGLIEEINQRSIPFYKTMFLPENIMLFYATSDSGSAEFMANKLIHMCDNGRC